MAPYNTRPRQSRSSSRSSENSEKQVEFSGQEIRISASLNSLTGDSQNTFLAYVAKLGSYFFGNNITICGCKENATDSFQRTNADCRKNRVAKNVMDPMVPCPDKYSSKNNDIIKKRSVTMNQKIPSLDNLRSKKVFQLIREVVDYGVAHGVIVRSGSQFRLSHEENNAESGTSNSRQQPVQPNQEDAKNIKKTPSRANDLGNEDSRRSPPNETGRHKKADTYSKEKESRKPKHEVRECSSSDRSLNREPKKRAKHKKNVKRYYYE